MKRLPDIVLTQPLAAMGSLLLAAALATALWYYGPGTFFTVMRADQAAGTPPSLPDYEALSEGIHTVWYDGNGQVHYILEAERQRHFKDSSSDLEQPVIRLFREGMSRWDVRADRGKIEPLTAGNAGASALIELSGAVSVHGLDEFGSSTRLSTEFLAINTETETLETDQPVRMVTNHLEQTAVGLFADLADNSLLFLSDSRGRYEPATGI